MDLKDIIFNVIGVLFIWIFLFFIISFIANGFAWAFYSSDAFPRFIYVLFSLACTEFFVARDKF